MNEQSKILKHIRLFTWVIIVGLVISGATAIPLEWELNLLSDLVAGGEESDAASATGFTGWILKVRDAVADANAQYPFMAYGTDWLAFGHFVIAIAFIGALRDPRRNIWLFQFGMIACALVIPYALIMGGLREIPPGWRLIDCAFGVVGFAPLWLAWRLTKQLEGLSANHQSHA
jgi:hypothetical protein